MAEEFFDADADGTPVVLEPPTSQPEREPVLVLLIGSREGIANVRLTLYQLGFAQIHEWSQPQSTPDRQQWMSVMTKQVRLD